MRISRGESTGGISYQWDQGTSSQFPARSCVHVGPSSGASENSRDSEPTACWILYPRPVTMVCVCLKPCHFVQGLKCSMVLFMSYLCLPTL